MLKRAAELEETISNLPRSPHDDEIEKLKKEIARLKALPATPAQPPADAVKLASRLRKVAEKVASSIVTDLAKKAIYAAAGAVWEKFGNQAIALADAIRVWIESLTK
jgi:cell division septum initiation protein DivIVA